MSKHFIQLSAKLQNGITIQAVKVTDSTSRFIVCNDNNAIIHEEIVLKQHALDTLLNLQNKYQ